MSTTYTGDPSTVSNALARTITNATNASPIVITTSAAHLFATSDVVEVEDVGGNTAANGTWTITVLTSTTFSLDGSTGSGAYTAGGTATDRSLTPQFTIPSDGDDLDAASVNVALETLADRTQFLAVNSKWQYDVITTSCTWTSQATGPAILLGVGGGGGGGGGASGGGSHGGGGAGGGGARPNTRVLAITDGQVVSVTIGAGGAGGAGGPTGGAADGSSGADGADTTFGGLATFKGAQGGAKGVRFASATRFGAGGLSADPGEAPLETATDITTLEPYAYPQEGQGGWGLHLSSTATAAFRRGGARSQPGGDPGTDNDAMGGGGGGASGWAQSSAGAGGDGGTGGAPGTDGTDGGDGTLGAGGGGGGGGGDLNGAGGDGGDGGGGALIIIYQGPKAVIS